MKDLGWTCEMILDTKKTIGTHTHFKEDYSQISKLVKNVHIFSILGYKIAAF